MTDKEQRMRRLSDAGCDPAACAAIGSLLEAGNTRNALRRMRLQRCEPVDETHKSQRKVNRMDCLIRAQEKRNKQEE